MVHGFATISKYKCLVTVLKPPLCGAVPCVNSPNHLYLDVYLRALSAYFLRPPLT